MTAWIVRAGKHGEREQWAMEQSLAGGGFQEASNLTPANTKDQVRALVDAAYSQAPLGRRANFAGQLWALRGVTTPGDLIVMPLKTTKKIAIGVCTSGYQYRDDIDASRRHTIGVDWKATEISRAGVKDDLLNTINGAMTIFQASKHSAKARLRSLIDTGIDPGSSAVGGTTKQGPIAPGGEDPGSDIVDLTPAPTLEAIRDRVTTPPGREF